MEPVDIVWKKVLPAGTNGDPALTIADDGAVVLAFAFDSSTFSFDGQGVTRASGGSSAGSRDIGVAVFEKTGSLRWLKSFGGDGDDYPLSVATDVAGNVLVGAAFNSPSFTLGATSYTRRAMSGGFFYYDGVVLKLRAADGRVDASHHFTTASGASSSFPRSVARSGSTMAFGVSHFGDVGIPMDGQVRTFMRIDSASSTNFVVGVWNPATMEASWVRAFTGALINEVAADEEGGLAFSAFTLGDARDASSTMTFGKPYGTNVTPAGYTIFGSIGPASVPRWTKILASENASKVVAAPRLAFEPDGNLATFGRTQGRLAVDSVTIDPQPQTAVSFVARFSKAQGALIQGRVGSGASTGYEQPSGFGIDPWGDYLLGFPSAGFTLDAVTVAGPASLGTTLKPPFRV